LKQFFDRNLFKVWPFLFSHYSFESTNDQRVEIDQTIKDRYHTLINEWQNAEEIVTQLDIQRSNRRKNLATHLELNQNSNGTAMSSVKKVLAKISLPTFDAPERKYSITSNDVFYEVYSIKISFLLNFVSFRNLQYIP
jgi:hypothetical protein